MFFVPTWLPNVLFLGTFYLSCFQHVQLKRRNPVTNLQFVMMALTLLMILITTLYNRTNPWLSDGLFVASIAGLVLMFRQNRYLPPMKSFE
jgi:nicotinamide riboside transporter PnuC